MVKRGRFALLGILSSALLAGSCVVGAPPGFSDGDNWEVPLIAPLESEVYLAPVTINGEGPFVFMVDPDSPTSAVDSSIANALDLFVGRSPNQVQTENDNLIRISFAQQVPKVGLGNLSVRNMNLRLIQDGMLWAGGRRVRGIIGRDIISDSLIYRFDRDRGMMYIATQGNLKAPEGAKLIKFSQSYGNHRRYVAKATINDNHKVSVHLDLGGKISMLWDKLLKKFKLPVLSVNGDVTDEYGFKRTINKGTLAATVSTKNTEHQSIMFLPYLDKRLDEDDIDGIIGQNLFSRYNVTVNWHHKSFWLDDRNANIAASAKERLSRWGTSLDECATPACIKVTLASNAPQPTAPAAPTPGETTPEGGETDPAAAPAESEAPGAGTGGPEAGAPMVRAQYNLLIERSSPGTTFAYDVVLAAVDKNGASLGLPLFLASFQKGVAATVLANVDAAYAKAAGFEVVDMNPVGLRGCDGGKCVHLLPAQ